MATTQGSPDPITPPEQHDQPQLGNSETTSNGSAPQTASHHRSGWGSALWIFALVGSTHLVSHFILSGGMPLLLLASVLLGLFAYHYAIEMQMFTRRAVAAVGANEDGWLYRLLYRGTITKALTFTICVLFAGSFLIHANQMPGYIWFWLYLDAGVIVLLLRQVQPAVQRQGRSASFGLFGRKLTFVANLIAMGVVITATSFFMPVADLRSFGVGESFMMGWSAIQSQGLDPVLSIWAGLISGADQAVWNLMQQLSQQNIASGWKILIWSLFFLVQVVYLWVMHYAMLGSMVIAEQRNWRNSILGETSAARWGWGSFYLLIFIWLLAGLAFDLKLQQTAITLPAVNMGTVPAQKMTVDPCVQDGKREHAIEAVTSNTSEQVAKEQKAFEQKMDELIDARVNAAFAQAFKGVDRYLDWYYTVTGEWTRLGTLALGDINALMQEKMEKLIMKDSGAEGMLTGTSNALSRQAKQQFSAAGKRVVAQIKQEVKVKACATSGTQFTFALPSLSHDLERIALTTSTALAAGVVVGKTVGAAIATKLAASTGSKLAVKMMAKAAAKTAIKSAGSLAGAGVGAAGGLWCGPLAPLCSTVLAGIGFVGVDKLFMEGDEMINRADMRNDLIRQLARQRDNIKVRLKGQAHQMGESYFTQLKTKTNGLFVPAKNGV